MTPDEAKTYIVEHVWVPRQHITVAKAFVLENFQEESAKLLECFLKSVDSTMPDKVVLHQSVDPIPTLNQAAAFVSWKLAACEAIWGLISSGVCFPCSNNLVGQIGGMGWTTAIPGGSGSSSGFDLDELSVAVPQRIVLSRSIDPSKEQPLVDPDLYLKHADLSELDLPPVLSAVIS